MTGLLEALDLHATSGATPWHRASALSKMALAATLVGAAVWSGSPRFLAALLLVGLGLAASARLPWRLVVAGMAYPLLSSLLFAATRLDGTWTGPLLPVLRALTAGLAVVWLVCTTPYPDLFAPPSRLLPRAVGDGLFLTYRAFFALAGRAAVLWRALRLRGGLGGGGSLRVAGRAGEALGTLVLHGFERSQRLTGALRLRGHQGRVCGCRHYADLTGWDALPLLAALAVLIAAFGLGGRP